MAKAQMEIMGLAIIMVLLSMGMLFAIKFVFLQPESDVKHEFITRQIAQNTLHAILKTNICRGDENVESLIIDCFEYNSALNCKDGLVNSCEYARSEIKKMLDDTLVKWGNDFYFEANVGSYPSLNFNPISSDNAVNGCKGNMKLGKLLLPTNLGTLIIRLEICD